MLGVVTLGTFNGRCAQLRHRVQRAFQFGIKRCRRGPRKTDRTDRRAVCSIQRQRCGRFDSGRDGVGEYYGELDAIGVEVGKQDCST
jgi:hypothetical protein